MSIGAASTEEPPSSPHADTAKIIETKRIERIGDPSLENGFIHKVRAGEILRAAVTDLRAV
jgi:hypothetical protein